MRTRTTHESFATALTTFLPVLSGIVADSNTILDDLQIKEMVEPGLQFEQEAQKARAIRRMTTEVQDLLHKIARGMAAEHSLSMQKAKAEPQAG